MRTIKKEGRKVIFRLGPKGAKWRLVELENNVILLKKEAGVIFRAVSDVGVTSVEVDGVEQAIELNDFGDAEVVVLRACETEVILPGEVTVVEVKYFKGEKAQIYQVHISP